MRADSFRLFPFSQFAHDATQGIFESAAGEDPANSERALHITVDASGHAEARVVDPSGADLAHGDLQIARYIELSLQTGKQRFWAAEVAVDGVRQGVVTRATPQAGFVYDVTYQRDLPKLNQAGQPWSGAWLAPGTLVSTTEGDQPVEWLESGMRVITRDRGAQPLAIVLRQRFPAEMLNHVMVSLPQSGEEAEGADDLLTVSPATCVLLRDPLCDLNFGAHEVLAPAGSIGVQEYVGQPGKFVTLTGLVFASHELVQTSGGWLGSWFWSEDAMAELNGLQILQALRVLGLAHRQQYAARTVLTQEEAVLVRPETSVPGVIDTLIA